MWFFGKKHAEAVKKEAEAMVTKVLNEALLRHKVETSGNIASGLQEEFMKMNEQIMAAFDRAQQTGDTNAESIAILAQSVNNLIQVYNTLVERVSSLESQLSVSGIRFTKSGTN